MEKNLKEKEMEMDIKKKGRVNEIGIWDVNMDKNKEIECKFKYKTV